VLDKYTHPNIFIAKHNGDDKPHDYEQYIFEPLTILGKVKVNLAPSMT